MNKTNECIFCGGTEAEGIELSALNDLLAKYAKVVRFRCLDKKSCDDRAHKNMLLPMKSRWM
jgi:hypothetical protein